MSVNCIQCGRKHNRKKFCSNKCKDRYHNRNNPRGFYKHLAVKKELTVWDIEDSMDFQDPYSLGQD